MHGKLLEDLGMVRVLLGLNMLNDVNYDPNEKALSSYKNLGTVHEFGHQRGRVPMDKEGTRAAAESAHESHWQPLAPPNFEATRPKLRSSGPAFGQQITRLQGVTGAKVQDGTGPEYYAKAHDSMTQPVYTSARQRVGLGTYSFALQPGRVPMHKSGTRAAAGSTTSIWEPGAGYSAVMQNKGGTVAFDRQPGRVRPIVGAGRHSSHVGVCRRLLRARPTRGRS